jgi:ribosomal protein S18 acetylase RimI-like enzyme
MLPTGYRLVEGSEGDRPLLLRYLRQAYRELAGDSSELGRLARIQDQTSQVIQSYLSSKSLVTWIEVAASPQVPSEQEQAGLHPSLQRPVVAGLWAVPTTDLRSGDRQWQVLLLYVEPAHRRRGLARHLLSQLEAAVRARGDRRLSLQVFSDNQPALNLYQQQGYQPEVLQLVKHLNESRSSKPLL